MYYGTWLVQHLGKPDSPNSFSFMDTGPARYNVTIRKHESPKEVYFLSDAMRLAYTKGWISISPDPFAVPGTVNVSKDGLHQGVVSSLNFLGDNPVISLDGNTANIYDESSVATEITVGTDPNTSDFTSIAAALASTTDNSASKRYAIKVGSGLFVEPPFALKPFVVVIGEDRVATRIEAAQPDATFITGASASALFNVSLGGATGASGKAIYYEGAQVGDPEFDYNLRLTNVSFTSNNTHVHIASKGRASVILHDCSTGGNSGANAFDKGFIVEAPWANYPDAVTGRYTPAGLTTGSITIMNLLHTTLSGSQPSDFLTASGYGAQVFFNGLVSYANGATGACIKLTDGAAALGMSGFISGYAKGVYTYQSGNNLPTHIRSEGVTYDNNTIDVDITDPGTSGYLFGKTDYLKTVIANASSFYIAGKDRHTLNVAKKGGDFTSVAAALAAINDNATDKRYLILVGPGTYVEPEIDLAAKPFVSVTGLNIESSVIKAAAANHHVFTIGPNNEVSFLRIEDAGPGYAGIANIDNGYFGLCHKVAFNNCDIGLFSTSITQDTYLYGEYVDMNGSYSYAAKAVATNGFISFINLENFYPYASTSAVGAFATGPGSHIVIAASEMSGSGLGEGVRVEDGARMDLSASTIHNVSTGALAANVGAAPTLNIMATSFLDNTLDLVIQHPGCTGSLSGSVAAHTKVSNTSSLYSWNFVDVADGEFHITNKLTMTFADGSATDISTLLLQQSTSGILDGGAVSVNAGLTIDVASGFGYIKKTASESILKITWPTQSVLLAADTVNYLYLNENSTTVNTSPSRPDLITNIFIGRVVTNATSIEFIDAVGLDAKHIGNKLSQFNRDALGPIYVSGSILSENVTPLHLDITGGYYFFGEVQVNPSGGTNIPFHQYYHNGTSAWSILSTSVVNNTQWNNGNTLAALTPAYFTKHSLYVVGDGANEKYFLVLGQSQHALLLDCINSPLPSPPSYFNRGVTLVSVVYVQEGLGSIVAIDDARPRVGFRAAGVTASAEHGSLLGLDQDNHPQYFLADGTRVISGNVDMGGNQITNVGNVDGVDISAHVARHAFNGADALPAALVGELAEITDTVASAGTNNTKVPRADHAHAHGARGGGTLHAEVTQSINGFMSAADKLKLDGLGITYRDNTITPITISTVAANILSQVIPAGGLGTTGMYRVTINGRLLNNSGGGRPYTIAITYGGTTLWGDASANLGQSAVEYPFQLTFVLAAQGTANSQSITGSIRLGGSVAGSVAGTGDISLATWSGTFSGQSAVDSTLAQTLAVTILTNNAAVTQTLTRYNFLIEKI